MYISLSCACAAPPAGSCIFQSGILWYSSKGIFCCFTNDTVQSPPSSFHNMQIHHNEPTSKNLALWICQVIAAPHWKYPCTNTQPLTHGGQLHQSLQYIHWPPSGCATGAAGWRAGSHGCAFHWSCPHWSCPML